MPRVACKAVRCPMDTWICVGHNYRADWEPAAASGRRVLGVSSGLVGTIYTQSNSGVMENPYFEKLADFSHVHVDMWWFCPMWPKCAFGDQKGLTRKKTAVWQSPSSSDKNCELFKKTSIFFNPFKSKRGCFGSKNGALGCLGPGVRYQT